MLRKQLKNAPAARPGLDCGWQDVRFACYPVRLSIMCRKSAAAFYVHPLSSKIDHTTVNQAKARSGLAWP